MESIFEQIFTAARAVPIWWALIVLVLVECVDWITGVCAAVYCGTYKSNTSRKGLVRKTAIILFYLAVSIAAEIFKVQILKVLIMPYIISEFTSVYENIQLMKGKK